MRLLLRLLRGGVKPGDLDVGVVGLVVAVRIRGDLLREMGAVRGIALVDTLVARAVKVARKADADGEGMEVIRIVLASVTLVAIVEDGTEPRDQDDLGLGPLSKLVQGPGANPAVSVAVKRAMASVLYGVLDDVALLVLFASKMKVTTVVIGWSHCQGYHGLRNDPPAVSS